MGSAPTDALILVAGKAEAVNRVVPRIESRLEEAAKGVPAETRAATETGETRYMRPRPGSQRMYPETDIQDLEISAAVSARVRRGVPEPWTSTVERLRKKRGLSQDLALKLYDSESVEDFEGLVAVLKLEPSFIASVLVDLPARLEREGVPASGLGVQSLKAALGAVESGKVAKEAVPDVLRAAAEKNISVGDAIISLGLGTVGEQEVRKVVRSVLERESKLIADKGDGAFSPLMGAVMGELRGRADGSLVARILREELPRSTAR